MTRRTVYLAGPVSGCTKGQANDWRSEMINRLLCNDIKGVSPLRCEPLKRTKYPPLHDDADPKKRMVCPMFGVPIAIGSKNFYDVQACDMTLAYFPATASTISIGTAMELAWARAFNKPTILVTQNAYIRAHPVVTFSSGWVLSDLDEALEVITGVLSY